MAEVSVGSTKIEFGLHLVEGDPGLTLILFIAFSLLLILGPRFGYYAHRNMTVTDIDTQRGIWRSLRQIGLFTTAYGVVGLVEILSSVTVAAMNVFLLATVFAVAFTIRRIHVTASPGSDLTARGSERLLWLGFVALVVIYFTAVTAGTARLAAGIEGTTALSALLYGVFFFEAQTANARLQGTLLDSLLRHLLPILVFSGLVGVLALATAIGVEPVVVWHVQVVFIIMTGAALMAGTIKLRQNLAGL
jgi:hypothetical protein